jgi:hypothetical protein
MRWTYEAFGGGRVFDLLANRDAKARSDQFGEVSLQLMVRESSHRDRVFPFVAAGEGQPQNAGDGFCILVKKLIKITHSEKKDGIAAGGFGFFVLLHHRRKVHVEMLPSHLSWPNRLRRELPAKQTPWSGVFCRREIPVQLELLG